MLWYIQPWLHGIPQIIYLSDATCSEQTTTTASTTTTTAPTTTTNAPTTTTATPISSMVLKVDLVLCIMEHMYTMENLILPILAQRRLLYLA